MVGIPPMEGFDGQIIYKCWNTCDEFPNHTTKRVEIRWMLVNQVKGGISGTFHRICYQRSVLGVFLDECPPFLDGYGNFVAFQKMRLSDRSDKNPAAARQPAQDCAQEFAPGEPTWSRARTASTRSSDLKAHGIKWLGQWLQCLSWDQYALPFGNHTWQWEIRCKWRFLAGKIIHV